MFSDSDTWHPTFIPVTFMYASKGMKFGSHPLLDCVEQLHTADTLQFLRNPVSKTYANRQISWFKMLL